MNLVLHLSLWGVLLIITAAAMLYKKWLENHCDHYIHLHNDSHDSAVIHTQEELCRRMELVAKLQTYLIVALIVYALVIAGVAIYAAWQTAGQPT